MSNQKKDQITPATENAANSAELDPSELEAVTGGTAPVVHRASGSSSSPYLQIDQSGTQDLLSGFNSPISRGRDFQAVNPDDVAGGDSVGVGGGTIVWTKVYNDDAPIDIQSDTPSLDNFDLGDLGDLGGRGGLGSRGL